MDKIQDTGLKIIPTEGISGLRPMSGTARYYWAMDVTGGDLFEAQELWQQGKQPDRNRLLIISSPDGAVLEPVKPQQGAWLGEPVFSEGAIALPRVRFPENIIEVTRFDPDSGSLETLAELPIGEGEDCYNLRLFPDPLMLTRHSSRDIFEILWPEQTRFQVGPRESFIFRLGERLCFSEWHEDPDYREEAVLRDIRTGEILDRIPGSVEILPNGERWLLR